MFGLNRNFVPQMAHRRGEKKVYSMTEDAVDEATTVEKRKEEADRVLKKLPNHIPILFERDPSASNLPVLDRSKWVVSDVLTICQLQALLRARMNVQHHEALYFIINKQIVGLSLSLAEVYANHKSEDNFLHITFASCEMFG